jgi:adenosine deaminase
MIPGDPDLYTDVIDAWSLRNWHPSQESGHRRFFSTFGRFGLATRGRTGDMLAEVSARAASQQVSYLELMHTADGGASAAIGRSLTWTDDLAAMRDGMLRAGLRDSLAAARRALDAAEARQREVLRCGTAAADLGCAVTVRYLYQVARGRPLEEVFGQILMGFELSRADPRVVGLNLVQPEDYPVPMVDYQRHMAIIGWLHTVYPGVRVTLHAGELAEGLVPPDGLRFHIREAIEVARAERIGHGVAVMHEADALGLLSVMAERRVLVEIALSSNDIILGVRGARHPLRTYLRHGVPVTLVTDDEGVARSSLTQEYRRAVEEHGLDYSTLREMVRNSIAYAFVEEPEKQRLLDELNTAFARFEAQWARP